MVRQFHVQDHSDEGGPEGAAENDRGDSERAHRGTTLFFWAKFSLIACFNSLQAQKIPRSDVQGKRL
jgi:hypothetical protein